ncbi:MAG: hypothetical protein KIS66_08965 [Fimbriimonadaceae bacterium]|nr:hypothetical protein [Fimbriimonadaceae bacterium]
MRLRAACAQIAPEKTRIAANLDRIAEIARQAADEGADLLVFPETVVSGYFVEGGVFECALTPEELRGELATRLSGLAKPLDLVVGYYERHERHLYNSAAYLETGPAGVCLRASYRKFFLPTYGVFDEERFVAAGRDLGLVETRFGKVGILICEDVWHSILPTMLAMRGAEIIVVPSASPARGFEGPRIANLDRYDRMLRAVSEEHGVFTVNAMLVGFEGGKGFVGGSRIVDPYGKVLQEGPIGKEGLVVAELDLETIDLARAQSPLLADLRTAWSTVQRLVAEIEEGAEG